MPLTEGVFCTNSQKFGSFCRNYSLSQPLRVCQPPRRGGLFHEGALLPLALLQHLHDQLVLR